MTNLDRYSSTPVNFLIASHPNQAEIEERSRQEWIDSWGYFALLASLLTGAVSEVVAGTVPGRFESSGLKTYGVLERIALPKAAITTMSKARSHAYAR